MKRREGGYAIGVVNPLTLVGKEVRHMIRERGLPCSAMALIDSMGTAEGTLTEEESEAVIVTPASPEAFSTLDIVFFCGDAEANEEWIDRRVDDGFLAVDLCQPPAIEAEGIQVIADVNLDVLTEDTTLIVSPHPMTVTLATLLDRIARRHPIELCAATIIRSASDFGKAGIDELFAQTISVLNIESPPQDVFGRQIAFNLYPAEAGRAVDHRIAAELQTALGGDLPVTVSVTQGTLFHGHTFSIFLRLEGDPAEDEVSGCLRGSEGIALADDEDAFSTVDAGGRDEILVSRVARDPSIPGGFWIWAASDNLRRGTALNAILAVEHMIANFGEPVN